MVCWWCTPHLAICTFANILNNTRVYVKSWLNVYPIKMRQGNGERNGLGSGNLYYENRTNIQKNCSHTIFPIVGFGWLEENYCL